MTSRVFRLQGRQPVEPPLARFDVWEGVFLFKPFLEYVLVDPIVVVQLALVASRILKVRIDDVFHIILAFSQILYDMELLKSACR